MVKWAFIKTSSIGTGPGPTRIAQKDQILVTSKKILKLGTGAAKPHKKTTDPESYCGYMSLAFGSLQTLRTKKSFKSRINLL